ncbi:MAG: PH domain-containing protein [Acidimicrobiales bacterium]
MTPLEDGSIAVVPLPSAIKTLWRVGAGLETLLILGIGVAAGVLADLPALSITTVVVAVVYLLLRWWTIELRFDRWRWGVDDRWVERRSGVLVRRTQIVPRSRVQTLTTRTGPIDRRLGLSSIVIHTAGTHTPNLTIPHLERDAADRLRSELGG